MLRRRLKSSPKHSHVLAGVAFFLVTHIHVRDLSSNIAFRTSSPRASSPAVLRYVVACGSYQPQIRNAGINRASYKDRRVAGVVNISQNIVLWGGDSLFLGGPVRGWVLISHHRIQLVGDDNTVFAILAYQYYCSTVLKIENTSNNNGGKNRATNSTPPHH